MKILGFLSTEAQHNRISNDDIKIVMGRFTGGREHEGSREKAMLKSHALRLSQKVYFEMILMWLGVNSHAGCSY